MIKALEANHVGGIFVDRLTGYHYLAQDRYLNLSVVTSEHISHTATVGLVATSKQQHFNITSCLTYLSNFIRDEMLMVISTYNVRSLNLFCIILTLRLTSATLQHTRLCYTTPYCPTCPTLHYNVITKIPYHDLHLIHYITPIRWTILQ